jgi:hypothetical protein
MVKKEIKSIILYLDSAVAIDYLTDEQAGILFKAVLRYGRNGQMLESSDTALTALFTMLCTQIDRDHKKYEERCERNVTNAKKRYEKRHQEEQPPAIACDRIPPHPNACHNNSDNDNEHDNKMDTDDDNADALIISDASVTDYSFETVWSMYGKPVGNVEALRATWNSLSAKNKDIILSYIPQYVASTQEIRYRKNFENFLSERYWETHPLNTIQNETTRNTYPTLNGTERRKRDVYQNAVKAIASLDLTTETAKGNPASALLPSEIPDN